MSFFRLSIDKLLTKLPTPVQFNESQKAMIDGLNENRFFVHIAARRTGKSYAAAILAFGKLLEPGQQVMVVAPNFSLSSIILVIFLFSRLYTFQKFLYSFLSELSISVLVLISFYFLYFVSLFRLSF